MRVFDTHSPEKAGRQGPPQAFIHCPNGVMTVCRMTPSLELLSLSRDPVLFIHCQTPPLLLLKEPQQVSKIRVISSPHRLCLESGGTRCFDLLEHRMSWSGCMCWIHLSFGQCSQQQEDMIIVLTHNRVTWKATRRELTSKRHAHQTIKGGNAC